MTDTSRMSFDVIETHMGKFAKDSDDKFKAEMKRISENSTNSTEDVIAMQQAAQKWGFVYDLYSKTNERMGDIYKTISQKS